MSGDLIEVDVAAEARCIDIKRRVAELRSEFPIKLQRLVFLNEDSGEHTVLEDARTLQSYEIVPDTTINLVIMDRAQFLRVRRPASVTLRMHASHTTNAMCSFLGNRSTWAKLWPPRAHTATMTR